MTVERPLVLQELTLLPSAEWLPRWHGWFVARVAEGNGYWLQRGGAHELAPGDCLVFAGKNAGVLRASRIGHLRFQYYAVHPQSLGGLLTLAECGLLEAAAHGTSSHFAVFAARESIASEFAQIVADSPGGDLPTRARLLGLWTDAVAGLLINGGTDDGGELRERFRKLVGQMSELELSICSPSDLAGRLHCSERHLSRLFREKFGISLRTRQTELRLRRAGQLLAGSNAKIINVAYDSGYRHLGLFNTMFKKRFGMTPSAWRQNARKSLPDRLPRLAIRVGISLVALACHLASAVSTSAQTPVPIGSAPASTPTSPPTAPAGRGPSTFEVHQYEVRGNTLLRPETLEAILAAGKGDAVSLEDIRHVLANLQTAYRERGFETVAVSLPPQQLTNATVIVQVTEAPLTVITVVNNRHYSSNNVMRSLPSLHTNLLLNARVFERELDLANANRDRQIYPVLGPGPDPGTSALTLNVKDRFPLHGRFELNNQATPGTPDLRMNLSGQYNNLWDRDHQLGVQYSFTPEDTKSNTRFNESFFDAPLIANYSTYYRVPLGSVSSVQEQIDANPLGFGYSEVAHQFRLPPAMGRPDLTFFASRSVMDTGVQFSPRHLVTQTAFITIVSQDSGEDVTLNEGLGSRLSLPLREVVGIRSTLSFGLDFKRYGLASFNTNNFYITTVITNSSGSQTISNNVASPQPVRHRSVDYLPLNVALDVAVPDKLGTTLLNASANFNLLGALSGDADFAKAAYTTNARARYVTLNTGLSRDQKIAGEWGVLLRANGQWADGPLISNEQFGLGGTTGVRGYREGEFYGDTGWRLLFEPHTPQVKIGNVDGTVPFWARGSVFMDYGEGYLLDPPKGAASRVRMQGAGFAVSGTIGDHLDARLTFAWPMRSTAQVRAGDLHVYFGVGSQF